jgi:hypothetical protein
LELRGAWLCDGGELCGGALELRGAWLCDDELGSCDAWLSYDESFDGALEQRDAWLFCVDGL